MLPNASRLVLDRTRRLRSLSVGATLVLLIVVLATPSSAQVAFADASFSGSATGTVLHVDALQSGETRLEDTEVAFSGATVDSDGLDTAVTNELARTVQPVNASKVSYARGTGLEVGLGVTPDDPNQLILAGHAETFAPPTSEPVVEVIGPLPAQPLAYADALRGLAFAHDLAGGNCVLGDDLSRGLGYATHVQLLDAGADDSTERLDEPVVALDADDPQRAVSQSLSRTRLVPQVGADGATLGDDFGLMSEVRETIAPVTFLAGSDTEFTLEFLGEWVLRAVAGGLSGSAFVHYGPGEVSPETPVLRTIDAAGEVTNIVTAQDIFGDEGFVFDIPGVAEIAVGEDPRAIGGDASTTPAVAADGTSASAAVDVVRVKLLEQTDDLGNVTQRAAQVRIGHMEVQAQVPPGGIACALPVSKTATPSSVNVGETFVTPITVDNPFACDLVDVTVRDEITTVQGASFTVVGTNPAADEVPSGGSLRSGTVVWNDIGPIPPGESRTVEVTLTAQDGGRIDDIATATATLANCRGEDTSLEGVALAAAGASIAGVSGEVRVPVAQVLGDQLARTGPHAASTMASGSAMLALAFGLFAWRRRFG